MKNNKGKVNNDDCADIETQSIKINLEEREYSIVFEIGIVEAEKKNSQ